MRRKVGGNVRWGERRREGGRVRYMGAARTIHLWRDKGVRGNG